MTPTTPHTDGRVIGTGNCDVDAGKMPTIASDRLTKTEKADD